MRMLRCKNCGKYYFPLFRAPRAPVQAEVEWGGYDGDLFIYRTKFVLQIKCPDCSEMNHWKTLR